jgi:hypothetical protein
MASKKAGRLAGLAALAGLAYMATRDKDKGAAKPNAEKTQTYAETAENEDQEMGIAMGSNVGKKLGEEELARRSDAAKKPVEDLGAIYDEAGTLSKSRRNTETGELYNPGVDDYQARRNRINANVDNPGYSAGMKKGGKVKKMASGGMTASASKRGDGIAQRGKTRGKMC